MEETPSETTPLRSAPPRRQPRSRLLYELTPPFRALFYLIVYIFIELAVAASLSILPYYTGGSLFRPGGFGNSAEFSLLAYLVTIPPQLLFTGLFVRFLDGRTMASLGLRWPDGGRPTALRQLVTGPLGALAILGIWLMLVLALPDTLAAVRFGGLSPDVTQGVPWWHLPSFLLFGILLIAFLLQGGVEELIIRGYVYRTLRERWPPWLAALASSLVFSLLHAGNPNVSWPALVNIVLAGLVFTALVERTGSLWSATLAHGVWNFALACLLSVPVSGVAMFHLLRVTIAGDPTVTGAGFGPEGSVVLTAIGVPLIAWLWRGMWRRMGDRPWALVSAGGRPSAPEDVPGAISS